MVLKIIKVLSELNKRSMYGEQRPHLKIRLQNRAAQFGWEPKIEEVPDVPDLRSSNQRRKAQAWQ
jgi:hypothetical protein